jgi:hypothetical protein
MAHKFDIGQMIELEPNLLRSIVAGPYEVRKLVPAADCDPNDPCYLVKSVCEQYQRAVPESQIARSKALFA